MPFENGYYVTDEEMVARDSIPVGTVNVRVSGSFRIEFDQTVTIDLERYGLWVIATYGEYFEPYKSLIEEYLDSENGRDFIQEVNEDQYHDLNIDASYLDVVETFPAKVPVEKGRVPQFRL